MTSNQRKHRSQMTKPEVTAFESFVHAIKTWENISPVLFRCHAKQRMSEWKVGAPEVLDTLRAGTLVEVHRNAPPDVRALLRKDFGRFAVCVVVSLVHREVVTVYVNLAEDRHYTLDRSQYQWRTNLLELVDSRVLCAGAAR